MAGQDEAVARALEAIQTETAQIRRALQHPQGKLLAAIKHASTMLNELRVGHLAPRHYYELYIACFDALTQLEGYLREDHRNHHLADVYEIVQYTGHVLPRLYLMITVGAAFLGSGEAPVAEVLRDMLEMSKGIQDPVHGLFLRYYLGQRTRDFLPMTPGADLAQSIQFTLTNFVEMNKLWVRLQHQGHSRDRDRRTAERKELQTIVGSSILRLAQLDNVDSSVFRVKILPPLLEQIVQCRDPLAQEYLLDVVCESFPADLHLQTLPEYLGAVGQLSPQTSLRAVLVASIDRSVQAAKELTVKAEELAVKSEEPAKKVKGDEEEKAKVGEEPSNGDKEPIEVKEPTEDKEPTTEDKGEPPKKVKDSTEDKTTEIKPRGDTPAMVETALRTYWELLNQLTLSVADRAFLAERLVPLSAFAGDADKEVERLLGYVIQDDITESIEVENFVLSLFNQWSLNNILTFFRDWPQLLASQSKAAKQRIASRVLAAVTASTASIDDVDQATRMFELLIILLKASGIDGLEMAKLLHRFGGPHRLELLQLAHKALKESNNAAVIRATSPVLVNCVLDLLPQDGDPKAVFRLANQCCRDLVVADAHEQAHRLYVLCASAADYVEAEEAAYEFVAQAFTVYEENLSDSRSQFAALAVTIRALQRMTVFGSENYDTLASRANVYGQRLLKKADQCHAVLLSAHLFWDNSYATSAKVLERLQRALRIADGCMEVDVSLALFGDVLDHYLYFLEHEVDALGPQDINDLIALIVNNLAATATTDEYGVKAKARLRRTLQAIEAAAPDSPAFAAIQLDYPGI